MKNVIVILCLLQAAAHLHADEHTYVTNETEHFAFTSGNTYVRSVFKDDGSAENLGLDRFRLVSDNRLYLAHAFGPVKLTAMLPAFLYNGRYDEYLKAESYGIGDLRTGVLYSYRRYGTAGLALHLPTADRSKGLGTGAFGLSVSALTEAVPHALFTIDADAYFEDKNGQRRGTGATACAYGKWMAWTGLYFAWRDADAGAGSAPAQWRTGFKILQHGQGRGKGSVVYTLWTDLAGRNTDKGYGFTLGLIF